MIWGASPRFLCAVSGYGVAAALICSLYSPLAEGVPAWVGDLHAVKHLRYTESLPCLNGTTASRYVEENFQKTVGFLIKA